jgi:hypothetical protein
VRAHELGQLFNSLDPSPFHERDLDDDAEAYIVGWARELPERVPLSIIVHLPAAEILKAEKLGLHGALAHYFADRAEAMERELREQYRKGRRFLLVGVLVLAVSNTLAHLLRTFSGDFFIGQVIAEGLVIFGWVANWRPAEVFLYDVWETRRTLRLYQRLARAKVVVKVYTHERPISPAT